MARELKARQDRIWFTRRRMRAECLCRILLIVLAVINCAGEDWPMLGHDAARSGGLAAEIHGPFVRKWHRMFPDEGMQSGVQPIIARGHVFLGTLAGRMHAMDAATGRDTWSFQTGEPILHSAAFSEGRLFFGAANGVFYGIEAITGNLAWSFQTGAAIWNAPAVDNGLVLAGGRDGWLYALEAATGKLKWRANTGAPLLNSPALDTKTGRVYIGSEAMRVHAFTLADGREIWRSEKLPGASMRGYHPVIAPDGSVLVTTQPVIGYDRFQALLLEMVREVFGDFASWRHKKDENEKLRAENFLQMEKPETYPAQLNYLRRRLAAEPAFQTFFVLDPETGRQRFVAPIVASESMNGPGAPPVVTSDRRVIVKFQALLRSRYEHYSPFLNVGYLDTTTGHITPLMDESRTYGWHDSLLLVHDEQCQLSLAGRQLFNTHQDNVNVLNLDTLKGSPQPLALNIHEPARGEALAILTETLRGRELTPGNEWFIRGTAVYGGGSVLDVPVAISGDSFYYLPAHELNSGCALVAYRTSAEGTAPKRSSLPTPKMSTEEWGRIQELPWDWDTLATPRLKNLLEALPGPVPGTVAKPLATQAEQAVTKLADTVLDEYIWTIAFDPSRQQRASTEWQGKMQAAVRERIEREWRPLVVPAGKAPEEAYRFFGDPAETLYTLLLARPFLDEELQGRTDMYLARLLENGLPRAYHANRGESRTAYAVPLQHMRVVDEIAWDDLARLYPLWLWSRVPASGPGFLEKNWTEFRDRLHAAPPKTDDDCGNSRLAGLIAYCRMAKAANDQPAVAEALPLTRTAIRARLTYELAHTRGGVIRTVPNGRSVMARWRRLTPEVARLIRMLESSPERHLAAVYADYHRPGWWIAWNVEQLMRNETPFQLPTTPMEIFAAKALLATPPAEQLQRFFDIPWCRADEFYIQKLALAHYAMTLK